MNLRSKSIPPKYIYIHIFTNSTLKNIYIYIYIHIKCIHVYSDILTHTHIYIYQKMVAKWLNREILS